MSPVLRLRFLHSNGGLEVRMIKRVTHPRGLRRFGLDLWQIGLTARLRLKHLSRFIIEEIYVNPSVELLPDLRLTQNKCETKIPYTEPREFVLLINSQGE